MLKGFKDFLFKGNIIDLATAVVVGTAFTALVSSVTKSLIEPIINVVAGGSVTGLSWTIIGDNPKTTIDFAAIINAGITFVITAAVVYFIIITPAKKMASLAMAKEGVAPEPDAEELVLLREIRDALKANKG
jgi:large conductance mechanosensitive channel